MGLLSSVHEWQQIQVFLLLRQNPQINAPFAGFCPKFLYIETFLFKQFGIKLILFIIEIMPDLAIKRLPGVLLRQPYSELIVCQRLKLLFIAVFCIFRLRYIVLFYLFA